MTRVLRHLPAASIVAVAIVLGLLAMHGLNLHGTASEHAASGTAIVGADAAESGHSAHFDTSLRSYSVGDTSSGASALPVTQGGHHDGSGGPHHASILMTCALVLLLFFVLAAPRGMLGRVLHPFPALFSGTSPASRVLSRAPSLQVLCISRT
ncbi:Hypotetical protein [Gulosibacter molinativorax]|nr:Hypotetical protein [Gulosibacter molinativorax]